MLPTQCSRLFSSEPCTPYTAMVFLAGGLPSALERLQCRRSSCPWPGERAMTSIPVQQDRRRLELDQLLWWGGGRPLTPNGNAPVPETSVCEEDPAWLRPPPGWRQQPRLTTNISSTTRASAFSTPGPCPSSWATPGFPPPTRAPTYCGAAARIHRRDAVTATRLLAGGTTAARSGSSSRTSKPPPRADTPHPSYALPIAHRVQPRGAYLVLMTS